MRTYSEVQILLNTFMVGFLFNALVRRLSDTPRPLDTIYPAIAMGLCLFMYVPLFLIRYQTFKK